MLGVDVTSANPGFKTSALDPKPFEVTPALAYTPTKWTRAGVRGALHAPDHHGRPCIVSLC